MHKNRKKSKLPQKNQKNCIYLLVMPKYWEKQILSHGSFPEVGEKQKAKKKKKEEGENNGQLRFIRHSVWRTQARLDQKRMSLKTFCLIFSISLIHFTSSFIIDLPIHLFVSTVPLCL